MPLFFTRIELQNIDIDHPAQPKSPTPSQSMPLVQLEKLLNSTTGGPLEELVQRAEGMGRLLSGLKEALGAGLASRVLGVNLRPDGELVVIAENPSWAARLRFESDALIAAARSGGAVVSSCKVVVARDLRDTPGTDER